MKRMNYMRLEFPGRTDNLAFASLAVCSFAEQLNPTRTELDDIRVAVHEAVGNCIDHAYPNDKGTVTVWCRVLKENTLSIIVKDKGIGISDVEQAMTTFFTTGGCKHHSGMGFDIIKAYATSCDVKSIPGKGTIVNMKKHIGK